LTADGDVTFFVSSTIGKSGEPLLARIVIDGPAGAAPPAVNFISENDSAYSATIASDTAGNYYSLNEGTLKIEP
jgi:hypothetical protein